MPPATTNQPAPTPPVRRPALILGALVALGLAAARYGPAAPSITTLALAGGLACAAVLIRGIACRTLLIFAVVLAAHGWFTLRVLEPPRDSLARHLQQPSILHIQGLIATPPRTGPSSTGRLAAFDPRRGDVTRFELFARTVIDADGREHPVSGRLWVRVNEPLLNRRAGDTIRLRGVAGGLEAPLNPGERDVRLWAAQRGIVGRISVDQAQLIEPLPDPSGPLHAVHRATLRLTDRLRAGAASWLDDGAHAGDPSHALMAALLLGQRSDDMRDLGAAFNRLGLAHVLSVSGFHLGVFVLFLVLAVRLTGERPLLDSVVIAAAVLIYLLFIPAQAPILRAGVMTLALLLAETTGRRYDRLNTLALVMVALLIWRPMDLWDIGFQLSFASVAALLTLTVPLREKLFGPRPNPDHLAPFGHLVEFIKTAIVASIAAWAATAPLVAYQLGVVSPIAPLATLIVLPLASLLIGVGYLALIVSVALPWTADVVLPLLHALASLITWTVERLDALPGTVIHLHHAGITLPAALAATLMLCWWMTRGTWRNPRAIIAAVLVAALITLGVTRPTLPRNTALRLDSLAVGDGACHLIRSGSNAMLFDCGSEWFRIGERTIPIALRTLGSPPVRTIVISHPDIDQYSGLLDLIQPLGVRRVLVSPAFLDQAQRRPHGPVALVVNDLRRRGVELRAITAGDRWTLGDITVEVLAPALGDEFTKDNDASLVLRLAAPTAAGEHRLLLTGDIESQGLAALASRHSSLAADIVEAPHHGSANRDAIRFVDTLRPRVVVQTTGPDRLDDPRWADVRARTQWLTTARDGAITVTIHRDGTIQARGFRQ